MAYSKPKENIMNYISQICSNDKTAYAYFKQFMPHREVLCSNCESVMILKETSSSSNMEGEFFLCHKCKSTKSAKSGTIFKVNHSINSYTYSTFSHRIYIDICLGQIYSIILLSCKALLLIFPINYSVW